MFEKKKRLINIVCPERSGGTLLRKLLASEICAASPRPLGLSDLFYNIDKKQPRPCLESISNLLNQILLSPFFVSNLSHQIGTSYSQQSISEKKFYCCLKHIYSSICLGEAASDYIISYEHRILELFLLNQCCADDDVFIVLLRDPRDIVASTIENPFLISRIEDIVDNIESTIFSIFAAISFGLKNYIFVFYEALVNNPILEIGKIKVWLEASGFYTGNRSTSFYEEHSLPIHNSKNYENTISISRIGIYRRVLNSCQIDFLEGKLQFLLDMLGYNNSALHIPDFSDLHLAPLLLKPRKYHDLLDIDALKYTSPSVYNELARLKQAASTFLLEEDLSNGA